MDSFSCPKCETDNPVDSENCYFCNAKLREEFQVEVSEQPVSPEQNFDENEIGLKSLGIVFPSESDSYRNVDSISSLPGFSLSEVKPSVRKMNTRTRQGLIVTLVIVSVLSVMQGVSSFSKSSVVAACEIVVQNPLYATSRETRQNILDLVSRAATINPSWNGLQHDVSLALFGGGNWTEARTNAIDRVNAKCAEIGVQHVQPVSTAPRVDNQGHVIGITGNCIGYTNFSTGEMIYFDDPRFDQAACPNSTSREQN